jgi:hypothetical protein
MDPVALGFRAHSGWAVAVAVRGAPEVVERSRIVTARVKQPYHAAEPLAFAKAEALIRACRSTSVGLAVEAIRPMIAAHAPACAAVLVGRALILPPLESILKSHAMIHTAEGVFYREILVEALGQLGLRVERVPEKALSAELGRVSGLGRRLGPPWTQDHKLATLAALAALRSGGV